ncbi:MAG: pentapeptide repeat-containing protein [Nocardioidaceae bacterium]
MAGVVSPPGQGQGQERWRPEELELRQEELQLHQEEVRHGRVTMWTGSLSTFAQILIAVAAVGAAIFAAIAVREANRAVDVAAEGIERQSSEDRLATAVEATGGDQAAQRAAGFRLLQQLASREITAAGSDREKADAHNLYGASLDVLEVYLRHGPDSPVDSATEGLGYGYPTPPIDNVYAAGVLRELMKLREDMLDLVPGRTAPGVDLSNVQLRGVSWPQIDFSWLGGHFFDGIDLREANLRGSIWGEFNSKGEPRGSSLAGAFLQCADLTGATLIGVDLTDADLRGATLRGVNLAEADLEKADLRAADLTGVKGLSDEQLRDVTWDETTAGLEGYELPPRGPLSTAPANTNGKCIGDYQALPET